MLEHHVQVYTGMLTVLLNEHVNEYGVLPEEQKALRKGRRGCLDALVIDEVIARETKVFNRNLSMGWVDYRKAFDTVPHLRIRKALKAIRTPRTLRKAIKSLIPLWQTRIALQTTEGSSRADISFKRGLFQGDSLSPLLFCVCVCVCPLSHRLNRCEGYVNKFQDNKVTHLMFMDDLKVFEESKTKLEETIATVEEALGMSLGLRKCAVAHAISGIVVQGGDLLLRTGGPIEEWRHVQVPRSSSAPGHQPKKDKGENQTGVPHTSQEDVGLGLELTENNQNEQCLGCRRPKILHGNGEMVPYGAQAAGYTY